MLRVVNPALLAASPWKNGGGVTREIARGEADGTLLWRLSIAEVSADGPFSAFEGLARILTVIEGAGLRLAMPDRTVVAAPFRPVAFSGDTRVEGILADGPVRDFNVIYDPRRIEAAVAILTGPVSGTPEACLTLGGLVVADGVPVAAGSVALGASGTRLDPGARALAVTLRTR